MLDALADVPGDDIVVVGFSLGGLTAPLVASRRSVRALIYLAALLPEPGISLDDQFRRGDRPLRREYMAGIEGPDESGCTRWVDFAVYHRTTSHDCEEPIARERFGRSRAQATGPYAHPCPLAEMPRVATRYLMCTDDRLMDNDHFARAVPERLGIEPELMPGDHSPMASRPEALVAALTRPFV